MFFAFFENYHLTYRCNACIISLVFAWNTIYNMREWLSGGAPPCQGGGRGFDPRIALSKITKRTSKWEVLFCYPRSAWHFSKPNCLAVWVRFLGELKRSSVVPEPRSTGPCGNRLALSKITKRTSEWEVLFVIREVRGTSRNPTAWQFGFDFSES